MKFDGNYRQETWEMEIGGRTAGITFVVDDEQVTLTYEAWARILADLGFTRQGA